MNSIYHDVNINVSKDLVFGAISDPVQLINWWPLRCTGHPVLGETYNFFFSEEYNWYGTVSKIEKNTSFYIKMTRSDKDWDPTTFGFQLSENNGACMLSFSHVNWPENNHHFRRSSYCWAILLNGLKNYVEKGLVVPFDQRA